MLLKSSRYWPYRRPSKIAVLGILLVAWITGEVLDPYRGSWIWRLLFSDSFVVLLTLDVSIDGERLELSRAIRCVQYYSATPLRAGQRTYRAVEAIGWTLSSGAALFLIVPRVCALRGKIEDSDGQKRSGLREIHPEHLPLLAWSADANDPQPVEAYVSESAYGRENARLKFHGIDAAIDSSAFFAADRDQFEWFRQSLDGPYQSRSTKPALRTFYAGKSPRSCGRVFRHLPSSQRTQSARHSSLIICAALPTRVEQGRNCRAGTNSCSDLEFRLDPMRAATPPAAEATAAILSPTSSHFASTAMPLSCLPTTKAKPCSISLQLPPRESSLSTASR